jgi:acyl-CoA hydrolase
VEEKMMDQQGKSVRPYAETTHIVMSEDINQLGNLHGGTLMQWVDIAGAVAATRHAHCTVTTAALDSMDFKHPVPLGAIVTLKAFVTWTGTTSLEVRVDVYSEKVTSDEKTHTNTAYLVFVALGYDGKPHRVPDFIPETEEEKKEYERAVRRREERLRRKNSPEE